ncbi:MAG TPA: tetratricopeptide repeat protein, partial [Thermoanaerobaculia bacterium]|nr:tetratricopeptide repeat protein [Thermoanaerobaculia bacterium]
VEWLATRLQEALPMLRRSLPSLLALVLLCGTVQAQSGGEAELALGRAAFAQKDWISAIEHFSRATGALDPEKDREALADAYLQLGLSYLTGLDRPAQALPAFVKSAELAASPATAWLWASMAADKLGRTEEAAQYKERAMPPSVAREEAPPPPATIELQVAEPAPEPVPAVPEPEPVPAPAPPAPPAAETQSVPAAAAEPLVPEPRPEARPAEPDAFQHFFGKKDEPKREEPKAAEPAPANAEPKPAPDAFQHFFGGKKDGKPEEKGKGEPASEKKPEPKVDAFDYFFGKKRKAAGAGEEKKPAEPTEESATPPPALD